MALTEVHKKQVQRRESFAELCDAQIIDA